MSPRLLLVLVAVSWAVAMALTPVAARLASRWGWLDRPARHKFHSRATPLLGGLALYLAVVPPLLVLGAGLGAVRLWSFAGAVTLLFLVGLWDDRHHLPIAVRLPVQVAAAVALVAGGFRAELPLSAWFTVGLSLVWIVGVTNAVNLLDSMDGAAAGVTAVAATGFLALAEGSPLAVGLAATLLGATLGFLPFNLHRARIFMGDAGSLVLGFSLAAVGLEARFDSGGAAAWMIPLLLLAVPIFDTTLVSWSRLRRGKNPMTHPGSDHFAHRLSHQGLGVRGAVAGLYLLAALGFALAWMVSRGAAAWPIGAAALLVAGAGVAWLERRAFTERFSS